MAAPTSRRALSLLPPCATTGIGSLPHTQLELALQAALQLDVPFLPQLPAGNPSELMIPAALDGVPGLAFDGEGMCTIDLPRWERERAGLEAALDQAFESRVFGPFEPSPQACRAFRPFIWEVEHRKLPFAKVQIAGPFTVRWLARTSEGGPAALVPALEQQIFRLVMAKALALARAVRAVGATPIVFLDEPGLYALERTNPQHLVMLQELKLLALALQQEGALVGVHCCSNTDWPLLLDLGLDLLSTDVRLSLDALVADRKGFARYLASGATLSLGIVPTDLASSYEVRELVESVEATLRATLPRTMRFEEVAAHVLLSPACGLAMRTVIDAERIFEELRQAQRLLLHAIALSTGEPPAAG